MADVILRGTGDYAGLAKEYEKLHREHLKMKQDLANLGQESKRTNQTQSSGIGSVVRQLAGMATGYLSVRTAVGLVADEYRKMIEVQRRVKETSITTADAQIKALRNLGATSAKEREAFIAQVKDISGKTGVSERDIYLRASAAASARGDLSIQAAMDAVRESARLVPESAEEGTAVAGAALDLAKITGSTKAQENIGLLMAIGQTARVVDVGQLAENVAPAVTGVTARGDTPQQAGAIWSALTTGMADPTGRKSGTAALQLANQLAEFLPSEDTYKYETKTLRGRKVEQRVLDREGTGLGSTLARIEYLQQNQAARERFLAGASFEEKSKATVEQMLSGKGTGATALAQFLERIPTATEAGPLYEQRLGVVRGSELQQTAEFARRGTTGAERMELMNQEFARLGAARDNVVRILEGTGQGALGGKIKQLQFETSGASSVDRMIGMLESESRRLDSPSNYAQAMAAATSGMGWGGGGRPTGPQVDLRRAPTELEQQQAGAIRELIGELRGLRQQIAGSRAAPPPAGGPRGAARGVPAAAVNQHVE